jgi:uncharacterized phage protein gp47/JayE
MYEHETFEAILNRMLAAVPSDVDKREGSIIYDALAPAAVELAQMYMELDVNVNLYFIDTATGEFLDRRAEAFNINRIPAIKSQRKGLFYDSLNALFDIPIGSRFSIEGLNYKAINKIATGEFTMECETVGVVGNQPFGTLVSIEYIAGLAKAELSDVLIPGADEESDDTFRSRFLNEVQKPGTSGNKADYQKWALEVSGVGGVQVIPLWNGGGSVKVIIIDSEKVPASIQLISDTQTYIDPDPGMGEGKAPISAAVTVEAAVGVNIDVTATMVLDGTKTLADVQAAFEASLVDHLKRLAFSADPSVKYVRIGSLLLDTDGVQDYSNLLVNGGTANIVINTGQVAVKGAVTLS